MRVTVTVTVTVTLMGGEWWVQNCWTGTGLGAGHNILIRTNEVFTAAVFTPLLFGLRQTCHDMTCTEEKEKEKEEEQTDSNTFG